MFFRIPDKYPCHAFNTSSSTSTNFSWMYNTRTIPGIPKYLSLPSSSIFPPLSLDLPMQKLQHLVLPHSFHQPLDLLKLLPVRFIRETRS